MLRFLVPGKDNFGFFPFGLNPKSLFLAGKKYASSLLNNRPVLLSQEKFGTFRAPRQSRCYDFDGVDDVATLGRRLTTGTVSKLVLSLWFKLDDLNVQRGLVSEYLTTTQDRTFRLVVTVGGQIRLFYTLDGLNFFNPILASNIFTGQPRHVLIYFTDSTLQCFVDGVQTESIVPQGSMFNSVAPFTIGTGFNSSAEPMAGKIWDVRVYQDDAADEAYANRATIYSDPTAFIGSPVGHYWCQEEGGTVCYDSSGNDNHLTITNANLATFHATDSGILVNANNEFGYRLESGVYIPAAGNLAANGQALTATGKTPYPVTAEVPCVTGNGTDASIRLNSLFPNNTVGFDLKRFSCWFNRSVDTNSSTNQQVLFHRGTNEVITLGGWTALVTDEVISIGDITEQRTCVTGITIPAGWHKLDVVWDNDISRYRIYLDSVEQVTTSGTAPGGHAGIIRLFDPRILSGRISSTDYFFDGMMAGVEIESTTGITYHIPLQDGPGATNENRNIAWYASDGTSGVIPGAIVGGNVANLWANRCPHVKDWCIEHGGRIGPAGEFILGNPSSGLSADGNPLALSPGKHGNPYTRLNLNPFTAAEYNSRSIPTSLAPGGEINSTPIESVFRRVMDDGDDRFVILDERVSTSNLNKLNDYTVDPEGLALHLDFTRPTVNLLGPLPTWVRTSAGTYWDAQGVLRSAPNGVPRYTHELENGVWIPKGLLIEVSTQNKCTNFNANPTDLTGVTKAGDAASTLTLVDDSAALAEVGLSAICTSGLVYELDNTNGVAAAEVRITGNTGNTNLHTSSAFVRLVSGNTTDPGRVGLNGQAPVSQYTSKYQRFSATETPLDNNRFLVVTANAGRKVRFILNQLEENSAATSPIVVAGSAITRQPDLHRYEDMSWFDATKGTFVVEYDSPGTGTKMLLSANDGSNNNRYALVLTGDTLTAPRITVGGAELYSPSTNVDTNADAITAFAYQLGSAQHATNGTLASTGTPSSLPTGIDRMWLGFQSSLCINGTIKRILYYNVRKPNSWVQGHSSR